MSEAVTYDIAIVGAGIAGSALAVALAGHGMSIALIEPQPLARPELPQSSTVLDFDARVSALTPRSRALLEKLGAWQAIAAYRQCAYEHMAVWDADGTGRIDFDSAELGVLELGHIVENRTIVAALLGRVSQCKDIHCFSPDRLVSCERLAAGPLRLQLEQGGALEVGLVVGADGAQSKVREMMGFATREWDYGHCALVATVQVAESHENTAWQRFLPSGPLAFLPLPSGGDEPHLCSIVWSLKEGLVEGLLELDDNAFCARLSRAFESKLGGVVACSARFSHPLRQRHAVDYVQQGVALVADAAHTIHPLAGQGINLGLQDVTVLAEELLAGNARGDYPGQLEILQRYQRRRKGENLAMMAAMDGFKRLFEQRSLPLRWLRNAGMRGVSRLGPLKQRLMRHAMGID